MLTNRKCGGIGCWAWWIADSSGRVLDLRLLRMERGPYRVTAGCEAKPASLDVSNLAGWRSSVSPWRPLRGLKRAWTADVTLTPVVGAMHSGAPPVAQMQCQGFQSTQIDLAVGSLPEAAEPPVLDASLQPSH